MFLSSSKGRVLKEETERGRKSVHSAKIAATASKQTSTFKKNHVSGSLYPPAIATNFILTVI